MWLSTLLLADCLVGSQAEANRVIEVTRGAGGGVSVESDMRYS